MRLIILVPLISLTLTSCVDEDRTNTSGTPSWDTCPSAQNMAISGFEASWQYYNRLDLAAESAYKYKARTALPEHPSFQPYEFEMQLNLDLTSTAGQAFTFSLFPKAHALSCIPSVEIENQISSITVFNHDLALTEHFQYSDSTLRYDLGDWHDLNKNPSFESNNYYADEPTLHLRLSNFDQFPGGDYQFIVNVALENGEIFTQTLPPITIEEYDGGASVPSYIRVAKPLQAIMCADENTLTSDELEFLREAEGRYTYPIVNSYSNIRHQCANLSNTDNIASCAYNSPLSIIYTIDEDNQTTAAQDGYALLSSGMQFDEVDCDI